MKRNVYYSCQLGSIQNSLTRNSNPSTGFLFMFSLKANHLIYERVYVLNTIPFYGIGMFT